MKRKSSSEWARLTLAVKRDMVEQLDRLAREENRTRNNMIVRLLEITLAAKRKEGIAA